MKTFYVGITDIVLKILKSPHLLNDETYGHYSEIDLPVKMSAGGPTTDLGHLPVERAMMQLAYDNNITVSCDNIEGNIEFNGSDDDMTVFRLGWDDDWGKIHVKY